MIPTYTKILTIGSAFTESALIGDVIVQEKIDGSFFGFGIHDGRLCFRSKSVQFDLDHIPDKSFMDAVVYLCGIAQRIPDGWWYYSEFLKTPKHNTLCYERTPKNHLVLFDALSKQGLFAVAHEIAELAGILSIDPIPELYRGPLTPDGIKPFLATPSYLGKESIEGVVIKNYAQTIMLGGKVFPLFTKYVREEFKERNRAEWAGKKGTGIDDYIQSFAAEGRWLKAIQHLRDAGQLEKSPRDIGKLIEEIHKDLQEEECENIKQELYKRYIKDIQRNAVRGFPEFYKDLLLRNLSKQEAD